MSANHIVVTLLAQVIRQSEKIAELEAKLEAQQTQDSYRRRIFTHEIHAPLTVILSYTDLILHHSERLTREKHDEYLHRIIACINRIHDLLTQLNNDFPSD